MLIAILVYEKTFSQEFIKDPFLVPFYPICILMTTFFFVNEAFLSNYADDTALYSRSKKSHPEPIYF